MADPNRRPILIAGPTASGKSALAMALAEDRASCIINADALQVYDCWRVLTARPTSQDCQRVPHALYGHVDAARRYSVGDWLRDVADVLADLSEQGVRPVFVGGTGLYLTALTTGLASIPRIPPEFRAASEAALKDTGLARLADDIARDDPETFIRIDVRNPVRVQRAWEVLNATGRGLANWHRTPAKPVLEDWRGFVCHNETSSLNNAIRTRFERMIESGAVAECRAYRNSHLESGLPSSRALGAARIFDYLDGNCDLAGAIEAGVVATCRYAKRQRTWFRNRMADWPRIDPLEPQVEA